MLETLYRTSVDILTSGKFELIGFGPAEHALIYKPTFFKFNIVDMANLNYILVGSYSNDITTLVFDSTTKTLQVASTLRVGHHPSWIASHTAHPSLVWTGLEQSQGKILALSHDKQGTCKVVSEASSAGCDPCFIWADKHELIVANVRFILLLIQYTVFNVYLTCSIHRELLAFYRYPKIPRNLSYQPSQSNYMVLVQTSRDNNVLILIKLSSMKSIKNFWCQTWVQIPSND